MGGRIWRRPRLSLRMKPSLETYLIDDCCQDTADAFAVGASVKEPTNSPHAATKQRMAATLAQDQRLPFI
jgi:hypothetical protein